MFVKESVSTALLPKRSITPSVGRINIDPVEDKNNNSLYEIYNTSEGVIFYKQVEGRKGCKTSKVSSLEQVQTPSIVYNVEGRISSEGLSNLYDEIRSLQSKGRDIDSSCDEIKSKQGSGSWVVRCDISDLENPLLIDSKGLDGVVSDDKTDFDKCSSFMSDEESVNQLQFRRKRKTNIAGAKKQ